MSSLEDNYLSQNGTDDMTEGQLADYMAGMAEYEPDFDDDDVNDDNE